MGAVGREGVEMPGKERRFGMACSAYLQNVQGESDGTRRRQSGSRLSDRCTFLPPERIARSMCVGTGDVDVIASARRFSCRAMVGIGADALRPVAGS